MEGVSFFKLTSRVINHIKISLDIIMMLTRISKKIIWPSLASKKNYGSQKKKQDRPGYQNVTPLSTLSVKLSHVKEKKRWADIEEGDDTYHID